MISTKTLAKLGITTFIALLAGCASTSEQESRFSHTDGWRKGTVTEIGSGQSFIEKLPKECKDDKSFSQDNQKFVTVHYRYSSQAHWHTSPIANDSSLKVGDPVYINAETCSAPIVARHVPFQNTH